jgi:hypothetical protein
MRVGITGSRNGHPQLEQWLAAWVERHGVPELFVLGDGRGVDASARDWVAERGYPYLVEVAHWRRLGSEAGPERNGRMVEAVLAGGPGGVFLSFPCPTSSGTWDCLRQARKRRLKCHTNKALLPARRRTPDW